MVAKMTGSSDPRKTCPYNDDVDMLHNFFLSSGEPTYYRKREIDSTCRSFRPNLLPMGDPARLDIDLLALCRHLETKQCPFFDLR